MRERNFFPMRFSDFIFGVLHPRASIRKLKYSAKSSLYIHLWINTVCWFSSFSRYNKEARANIKQNSRLHLVLWSNRTNDGGISLKTRKNPSKIIIKKCIYSQTQFIFLRNIHRPGKKLGFLLSNLLQFDESDAIQNKFIRTMKTEEQQFHIDVTHRINTKETFQ